MALRTYPRLERPWLIALLVAGLAGAVAPMVLGGGFVVPVLLPLLIGAFVFVRRFARVIVSGVAAGVLVGAVVLGGLLRLAMRIVALTDPVREPELTTDTFFIIFIFGVFGLMIGSALAVVERLWKPRAVYVGLTTGVLGIGMFLMASDLRHELFNEGAGPFLNIPMFTFAFVAFGWTLAVAVAWLQRILPMTPGRALDEQMDRLEPAAVV